MTTEASTYRDSQKELGSQQKTKATFNSNYSYNGIFLINPVMCSEES